jgi:hypothetical protein
MDKLCIIIAGVNEWPRVIYTLRAVYEEFRDRADFELVYVDNFPDALDQWNKERVPDDSYEVIQGSVRHLPGLRTMNYKDHLSHWVCKRKAVESSKADFFLFLDAHVIPGRDVLFNQFEYYRKHHEILNGSLHVPTTYKILDSRALQYRMVNELDKGWISYSFTGYRPGDGKPYPVPCHTTDGSLISRDVYNRFGGWPEIMESWGGGENLFNFTLSILGMNKWMMPGYPLYHDGAPRGYSYNWTGLHIVNRLIAMYMVGGKEFAELYLANQKGNPEANAKTGNYVLRDPEVVAQRKHIETQQKIDIHEWAAKWKDRWLKGDKYD